MPEHDGSGAPDAELGARRGSPAPRFTLVSAVYNVEKYLDDFIASVEAQDYPADLVQVVMVDDGSTDSSARLLAEWQARRPSLVTVLHQVNAGVSSARNVGLAHTRGTWVSFPDPDDMLAPNYLSEVDAFLAGTHDVGMVATRRRKFVEATGRLSDHPLQVHFSATNRVRDLDGEPEFFHEASNSAFFRTEILERERLTFDERVRPSFEDGHFCHRYLMRLERPTVAFLATAQYTYRKRLDKSSVLDVGAADPRRYTDQLRFGYLDLLREAQARHQRVPAWLQASIIYQLSWYFQDDEAFGHLKSVAYGEVAEEFHRLLEELVRYLDPGAIRSFALRRFDTIWREVLLHSYDPTPWHSEFALVSKLDTWKRLVRVTYRFTGTCPHETYYSDGVVVEPEFAKTRGIDYFDRTVMFERIVWLPSGRIRVRLDESDVEVRLSEPPPPTYSLALDLIRSTHIRRLAVRKSQQARAAAKREPLGWADRLLIRFSGTRLVRRYFKNAWVLIDRAENANDSAEFLFRYLREDQRAVNAWFVIRKGSADYARLRAEGYRRLIPYGSLRWKLLMLNCRHLASSHADVPIWRPAALMRLGPPTWRFTFLQHGVTKSDLSRWLNPKDLDLIVTSTHAEHESIVGDGSPYRYTERETKLTGLPRFDPLRRAGELVPPRSRDLILLAPTWRGWLITSGQDGGRSTLDPAAFAATDFGINWLGLARDERLESLAEQHGLRVAMLLHPNLQPLSAHLDLPEHIEVLSYDGQDVRTLFARARVLVTDYSSVAFDAAYIERPVVYFQFDRERVWSGEHVGRPGYFDYDRDGFGPTTETLAEVISAITDSVEFGPHPRPEYAARIAATFPMRDGRCTERTFRAIRESTRRVRAGSSGRTPTPATAEQVDDAATDDASRTAGLGDPQTVERPRPSQ